MQVLIDTSAYSALFRGHDQVTDVIRRASRVFLNPIVLGELQSGFAGGTRGAQNERELRGFLASPGVSVAPINQDTAHHYAEILHFLRKAGEPIPTNDLWIAAGAMQHGLRLVTLDAHYKRVPHVITIFFDS